VVEQRHFGSAVRLELDAETPKRTRRVLMQNLQLAPFQLYQSLGPIGLSAVGQLTQVERADLKFPPFLPAVPSPIAVEDSIFAAIRRRDILLYHPYDSFSPVVTMLREAADDPDVLAIKQTLYRTGPDSPIVEALLRARDNSKQVSVLVEIKARFDEENNMGWARALERAGVHVVYGLLGLKTHAKVCLIVRRERRGICRYVHLATGNYNPVTARIYTDLGLFTCQADLADDASDLFNALTGLSAKVDYRKLLVAPGRMREGILARIAREVEAHRSSGDGYIAFKVNSLTDVPCIEALYAASRAGVRVDLQVRGICGLRPGVPGLSETIAVTSIVGRFLEHSRIFYFRNGGNEELLLGSADLMVRNLSRRVEVLFPVEDPGHRAAVRDGILFHHLADTVKARRLRPDGRYARVVPPEGSAPLDSQRALLEPGGAWRRPR
jgi:polyphosphate kinase